MRSSNITRRRFITGSAITLRASCGLTASTSSTLRETNLGDRTEFVYLLAWPDEQTMRRAWERFKADEEWKEIKKTTNARYGDLVGEIEDRTLTLTSYSPSLRKPQPR